MTPKEFSASLAEIAASARHHPEPGLAVAMLAQLLLDFSVTLEAALTKYHALLRSTDSYEQLTELAAQALADFQAKTDAMETVEPVVTDTITA